MKNLLIHFFMIIIKLRNLIMPIVHIFIPIFQYIFTEDGEQYIIEHFGYNKWRVYYHKDLCCSRWTDDGVLCYKDVPTKYIVTNPFRPMTTRPYSNDKIFNEEHVVSNKKACKAAAIRHILYKLTINN